MLKNIGGSLPVESVQWLAASGDQSRISERYIRPEMHTDPVRHSKEDGEIPVINMSRLINAQHSQEEVMKLGLACQEWGFFQLINHGVPEEVI
ncbi:putative (S)-norcoclaurine synthase [Dioscorea sansibarensis]